jgi:hypothetical protein
LALELDTHDDTGTVLQLMEVKVALDVVLTPVPSWMKQLPPTEYIP